MNIKEHKGYAPALNITTTQSSFIVKLKYKENKEGNMEYIKKCRNNNIQNKPKLTINELFSGIGAQIQGLKNINVFDNKVICTSDIDKDAMLSYAIIHCGLTEDYIKERLKEDNIPFNKIADWLTQRNIGYDYKKNKSYDWHKLTKTSKSQYDLLKYYFACTMSNNMGDISLIDNLPYADLWTYSFPCQDISVAGKQAGIKEGTRSGLLLEVERLLTNSINNNNAPKYLLLENVKNLVGGKHRADFDVWLNKLNELGFNTYWKVLNAKNCGIPQNRERVFAISIRKDIDNGLYMFPNDMSLDIVLKDMLDDVVDDKYYINKPYLLTNNKDKDKTEPKRLGYYTYPNSNKPHQSSTFYDINNISPTLDTCGGGNTEVKIGVNNNLGCIQVGNMSGGKWDNLYESARRVYSEDGVSPTIHTCGGGNIEPKVQQLITHNISQQVKVRKFNVDKEKLCKCLREHKNNLTNIEIAQKLNEPLTKVEHWFRNDNSFAIPDENVWFDLKALLNIKIDEFDKAITTYIIKDTLFGKSNKVYDEQELIATITTSDNLKIKQSFIIRKLTPKECWRLMGFTDEVFDKVESMGISNSQLYKQAGNSIVVDCIELLMEHLYKAQYDKDYMCKDENFTIPHN